MAPKGAGRIVARKEITSEIKKRSRSKNRKHNKNLVENAKKLRKNMTKEELHLWYDFLREYPLKFLRQKVFGPYILDFYCAAAKIAIEVDGSEHYEKHNIEYDDRRTKHLGQYGIKVIRVTNIEVNQSFTEVCEYIHNEVQQSPSQHKC